MNSWSRSASPSPKRLCPHGIFVHPRFAAHKEVSIQIRDIFHRFTDKVEPLSLDEAYLDVTKSDSGFFTATDIAKEIKRLILEETQLTASAGVASTKFADRTTRAGLLAISDRLFH
jgi:DNA polymerase-4